MGRLMLLLFGLIFVALFSARALALTTITTCQDLNSDDTYQLGNDLIFDVSNATSGYYCLGSNSADIVIDCQGYRIKGDNSGMLVGIEDSAGGSLQIRNCVFEDEATAVDFYNGGSLVVENSTLRHMSSDGFYLQGNSFVLMNINFTSVRGAYVYYYASGGIGQCQAVFANLTDTDTGLPIEFYNTSVDISNREFAELVLCGDGSYGSNSNLTNITVRQDYIPKWTDSTDKYDSWGTGLIAFGFDNLTISDSRFVNTNVNRLSANGGVSHYSVVNVNLTNYSAVVPFSGVGFLSSDDAGACGYYNFTDVLADGKPFLYAHDEAVSIDGGDYSAIALCNASGSVISDAYAGSLLIADNSHNVLVDGSYIKKDYGTSENIRVSYSDNATVQNSVVSGSSVFFHHSADFAFLNNSLEGERVAYAFLWVRFSSSGIFYNNIVNSSASRLAWFLSASAVMNNTFGGNYWTNSSGNGFSDTCVDGDVDGICDSSYSPPTHGTDYMPLSVVPVLNLPSPPAPPCSEGTYQCSGSDRQLCSSGVWTFVETCAYGCDSGVCNSLPAPLTGSGAVISDVGSGLGNFLSAIYLPLGNLILMLGIVVGVVAIFLGVAYVVKNVISRSD